MRGGRVCLGVLLLWLVIAVTAGHAAIPDGLLNLGTGDDLDLQADEGIEWRQKEQRYIARGNVVLRRGAITLKASTIGAHYDTVNDKTVVRELFAEGGLSVTTAREQLTGGQAVYNLRQGTLRITGGPIRLITPEQQASADTRFDYNSQTRTAVVTGNATITQDGNTLRADTLTLLLAPTAPGSRKLTIRRVDAVGNVRITTPQETLTGQSGFYDAAQGIVRINDRVVLRQGPNALRGSTAEVNLKTGVSTLENTNPADGGRVRGILQLDAVEQEKP